MKADLHIPTVVGVEVAVVQINDDAELWDVIIINRTVDSLENVIIASKGYGENLGNEQLTSTLRHVIKKLPRQSYARIEPIHKAVFHLCNEYWVSYYLGNELYDKKFVFKPDMIHEDNVLAIPGFDFKGVLQK